MTKEGYQKLQEELERLLKVERRKNIKEIEEAR
ncbi:MAG: transcription elongation factor GreA, partial [Thermodesulfovibrionales bacterium]